MVELNFYFISSRKDILNEDYSETLHWIRERGYLPLALEIPKTGNIYFFLDVMKQENMGSEDRIPIIIDVINHEVIECLTAEDHRHKGFHKILPSIGLLDLKEYFITDPSKINILEKKLESF